jgi:hypothetical protein
VVGERGEQQDPARPRDRSEVRDDISGESVGQPHVEQNQIRLFAPAQLDGLGTGRGVSHELEVARELQLRGNTVPDNGVVVDDADAKTSRTGRGHKR